MSAKSLWTELRRRGVLGAIAAYVVVAAGTLQLADVVSHGLDLPAWTLKAIIWLSVAGLPIIGTISWFYDLTSKGLVRTELPRDRAHASPALVPLPSPISGPSPQPAPRIPLDANALSKDSAPLAGRYRIEREIGAGGMGRVLAAHDEKLGRRVAIKVLTGAHEPSRLARFSQEARAAGGLEHPNVLAIYDLGDHDGSPFLVTELLDGAMLREVIKKGPIDPEAGRKIALQLARGLEAAHARGVVHRDLKPENLFLTRDGRLKILDFGLAKLTDPNSAESTPRAPGLTSTGSIFGTPGYLAPEQAKGLASDARSDIFAAGAVLYELLSGARAFPGGSLVEAGHAALTQEPPPLSRIPAPLNRVVQRCLKKDPAQRFQNGGELVSALEKLDDETAPLALEGPTWQQRWRGLPGWFRFAFWSLVALALISALLEETHPRAVDAGAGAARELQQDDTADDEPAPVPEPLPAPSPPPKPAPVKPPRSAHAKLPAIPPPPPIAPAAPENPVSPRELEDDAEKQADEAIQSIREVPGVDAEKLREQIRDAMKSRGFVKVSGLARTLQAAHAQLAANQLAAADAMLRAEILREPEEPYLRFFLFAVQRKEGQAPKATEELAAYLKENDDDEWPAPLASFYLGELSEEKLFAGAADEDDDAKRESQICEASYYAGLFHATQAPPDLARARALFERAAKSPSNDLERSFGAEDLARLGKPK